MTKNAIAYAPRRAAVSVDQINSFFEDGELPVDGACDTLGSSNLFLDFAETNGFVIAFVREDHPENSYHFKPHGPWPKHGIRGTWGAQFRSGLYLPKSMRVFNKGSRKDDHGYSGATKELVAYLVKNKVQSVYVFGLATDYCVAATAIGLSKKGFYVSVLIDACRAVNVNHGDGELAMEAAGITISTVEEEICEYE